MKKNLFKFCSYSIFSASLLLAIGNTANAQVGIGTKTPDKSAMLDVFASDKGLLFPRVSLLNIEDATTITTPATGLTVWNTNENMAKGDGIGVYSNFGTPDIPRWFKLVTNNELDDVASAGWLLLGNTGTNPNNNFVGTRDANDVVFRANNKIVYRITAGGSFLATGDPITGVVPAIGAGHKMFWSPAKQAFRAGTVADTQWDEANVGSSSVAFGANTIASGINAAATGFGSKATGPTSTAFGFNTTASGAGSLSLNNQAFALCKGLII